ncbi:hypothetical protein NX784_09420 [Massilia pinisoli]|uniref:Uncharacterized protein n=1 Tax=Massilia pinisoli TaxID=1772194 RepID=A0ABT1ZPJ3_9BURK|nr:hypothetical protein [Massilia pinisoli]MCS0581810.1 hypothetical protein [Massilia pinisoli]
MIYLLVALMSGYALGTFLAKSWKIYALCLPVSFLIYAVTSIVLPMLLSAGHPLPDIGLLIAAGLIQAPVLMLGVYLAQRKAKRSEYEL